MIQLRWRSPISWSTNFTCCYIRVNSVEFSTTKISTPKKSFLTGTLRKISGFGILSRFFKDYLEFLSSKIPSFSWGVIGIPILAKNPDSPKLGSRFFILIPIRQNRDPNFGDEVLIHRIRADLDLRHDLLVTKHDASEIANPYTGYSFRCLFVYRYV